MLHLTGDTLAPRERPRDDRDAAIAHPLHQPVARLAPERWRPRVRASIPWLGAAALSDIGMDFDGPRFDDEEAEELIALAERLDEAQRASAQTLRRGDFSGVQVFSW